MLNYPDQLEQFCIAVVPVGSRVTCNPPPTDTDQDLLCFVKEDDYDDLGKWLEKKGWEYEDHYRLQGDFMSYRKDHWNAIVTYDEKFFDNFIDATKACKAKNLLKKEERIAEFNVVFGVKKKKSNPYASNKIQLDFDALINVPQPPENYQYVVYEPLGAQHLTAEQAAAAAHAAGPWGAIAANIYNLAAPVNHA